MGWSLPRERLENEVPAHENGVPWFVLLGKKELELWNQTWEVWILDVCELMRY